MNLENILETTAKHIIEKYNYAHKENIYQLTLCCELSSEGYKEQREVFK